MGKPSITGLRLALLDGENLSLRRSSACIPGYNPNQPPENRIESIEVISARYCGRGQPLKVELNPWLNAVIGGRGSGKSSILEFGRFALGREGDLPRKVQEAVDLFGQTPRGREGDGAMQADTKISLIYRKANSRYRLIWTSNGSIHTIEEMTASGDWSPKEGDIRQRFPVHMFSQRQIAALAEQPSALLSLVDESPEVGVETLKQTLNQKKIEFLSLRAQIRVLSTQIAEGSKLRGSLEDVDKKLAVFKSAKHAEVLARYQTREGQRLQLAAVEKEFEDAMRVLANASFEVHPVEPELKDFGLPADGDIIDILKEGKKALVNLGEALSKMAETEQTRQTAWLDKIKSSSWQKEFNSAKAEYDQLKTQLEAVGTRDVSEFDRLNGQRKTLLAQIDALDKQKKKQDELRTQAKTLHGEIVENLRKLTETRSSFLEKVLGGNKFVQMLVKGYGSPIDLKLIERSFREIIGCSDENRDPPRFADDILQFSESGQPSGGFIFEIYNNLPTDATASSVLEQRWADLKKRVHAVRYTNADDFGGWFKQYIQKLKDEDIDRLFAWMPDDGLEVKYSPRGLGNNFRPLRQASLGQKAAAILAFILSYGTDPLIMDQPEDDLDNELIYDLIVKQIGTGKFGRQMIVATHNPNIVVNGDAELVIAMHDTGGACAIKHIGTLQDPELREAICTIMEGGHEAFDLRYQRIGPRYAPES